MWKLVLLLLAAILLFGCAGAPEEPVVEEPVVAEPVVEVPEPPMAERMGEITLQAELGVFALVKVAKQNFAVDGAADQPIGSWVFTVADSKEQSVYSEKGDGVPPGKFSWDGMVEKKPAAVGSYTGSLNIVYEDESSRVVKSDAFTIGLAMAESMGAVTLKAELGSFSPVNGMKQNFWANGIKGQPIGSWVFTVADSKKKSAYSEKGDGVPPGKFSWAGMVNKKPSAEGIYTGTLNIVYEDTSSRTVSSDPFLLDLSKPVPSFAVKGTPFTPDGDGKGDELSITVSAKDASPIQGWKFEIRAMDGTVLNSFTGNQPLPHTVTWKGKTNGPELESGVDYRIYGGVRDAAGNEGMAQKDFFVGAITTLHNKKPIIVVPTIQFPPNVATLDETAQAQFNLTVGRIAKILKNTPDMRLKIVGQANATRFKNNKPDPVEQKNILIPLSQKRGELVYKGLIERGIAAERLSFDGVGASDPAVNFADAEHRKMNRRILFYVEN